MTDGLRCITPVVHRRRLLLLLQSLSGALRVLQILIMSACSCDCSRVAMNKCKINCFVNYEKGNHVSLVNSMDLETLHTLQNQRRYSSFITRVHSCASYCKRAKNLFRQAFSSVKKPY